MASFLDAFQAGESVAKIGIDQYDRAKQWQEKLQEREQARVAAKAAISLEAERHAESQKSLTPSQQTEAEAGKAPTGRPAKEQLDFIERWRKTRSGSAGMDHTKTALQARYNGLLKKQKDTPEQMTDEDYSDMHETSIALNKALGTAPYKAPAAAPAPAKEEGISFGDFVPQGVKDFFHGKGAPAPAPAPAAKDIYSTPMAQKIKEQYKSGKMTKQQAHDAIEALKGK